MMNDLEKQDVYKSFSSDQRWIRNPILRGFHPDPSIVRVGEEYYIATSTFEWWPGIRLHRSTDLAHWELLPYPLNRISQLSLSGVGASQGVWAPCLSYDQGVFYLLYTVVKSFYCNMYDTNNYLVMATDIQGPWSDPIALHNFGFDPSLFHDEDGKKYLVSMVTDHRVPKKYAGRLVLQEYDPIEKKMKGPIRDIYKADHIFLEGPHILKRNGWYYLFSADTGTGELHGQTIQRSRCIWGPYEMYCADFMQREEEHEAYSILTSRHHSDILLQKAGHCDLVETPEGEWYAVHLCGRALEQRNPLDAPRFAGARRYMLGRETAIQKMRWTEDDWLVLDCGETVPQEYVPMPVGAKEMDLKETEEKRVFRDDFDQKELSLEYQSLRIPMTEEYISLQARPGYLRMYGRSGLSSKFSQTLLAVRITEFDMEITTRLEFEPEVFKQMAGLILLYDTDNYFYLHSSYDEDCGKCITLLKAENKKYQYLSDYLPIASEIPIYLKIVMKHGILSFFYQMEGGEWQKIADQIDGSFLSDEACMEGWFTGTMVGICCQDLTGFGKYADFDWFETRCL
ncbi:MAG: glycoside hydrolase family 43 protein [Lachnospiraceae bacterium]|nr:glycoside hydrolase family 43 protein [Lachnospiraceae bacterium]